MNIFDKITEWGIDNNLLTQKKQQTDKKIEYIREYIRQWAIISAERKDINSINFIDCMCNAGVYKDGDLGTPTEVLRMFIDLSDKYPNKTFRLFCNDISQEKIKILKKIIAFFNRESKRNIEVSILNVDVNEYLDMLEENHSFNGKTIFHYVASTVLFVDPFDFGTVEIPKVSAILKKYYCELIFNFFLSDYVRNIQHDKGRILKCLGGEEITTKDELISYMRRNLKVGHIKYLFAYQFKTTNNVELYQIVFATPSLRGLEVLKEALWKVFNGAQFHRNKVENNQITFYTDNNDKETRIRQYAAESKELLYDNFNGQEVDYTEIEKFLIEHTMLKEGQIIKNVITPMINDAQLIKCGRVKGSNYKKDCYRFVVKGDRR